MQLTSHARSFVRTTILANLQLDRPDHPGRNNHLYTLVGQRPASSAANGQVRIFVGLVAVALLRLLQLTALVAIGGLVVIVRDFCEERGVPYFPVRPRERIAGPIEACNPPALESQRGSAPR